MTGADGILNINKPAGMTSHDVVSAVRRTLGIRKAGHTGTLDPMAEGVLPVCIGKGTRITEYLDLDLKSYRCSMILGMITDTLDIWGNVLKKADPAETAAVGRKDIEDAFRPFHGVISQRPPMYSAIRVKGKHLYEYAREGKSVEVKTRQIYIHDLVIEEMDLSAERESTVTFRVTCSKGTYIRSICESVGEALGTGACMSALTRLSSGFFRLEDAVRLDDLEQYRDRLSEILIPTDRPLEAFGEVHVKGKDIWRMRNGLEIWKSNLTIEQEPAYLHRDFPLPVREEFRRAYRVYGEEGGEIRFLGVGFMDEGESILKAHKVFDTEDLT